MTFGPSSAVCCPLQETAGYRQRTSEDPFMIIDALGDGGPMPFVPQLQRHRAYARQRQMTISDLLLENRILFIGSSPELGYPEITDLMANYTIQKLLYLQYENKNQEIHMYINCPGGSVSATLAIYDTMQFLECPV